MASGFTVATTFKAKGNLGTELKRNIDQMKVFGQVARGLKNIALGGVFAGALGGAVGLQQGVSALKDAYIELDQSVTNAAAKFNVERGTENFDKLRDAASKVGLTTEHSSAQAAAGLDFLAMAGFSAEESMALLPGVANLATAANLDFATSTDIASDALGAFGMANGTAEQKQSALKKIMEQTAKTINTSNTTIEAWFEAVTDGAPSFTAAGQKLSTFNAAVGIMANSGVKGSKAGIALRGIMTSLTGPTSRASKTLKKLGVRVSDEKGNVRDFADILADFETGLGKLSETKQLAALKDVFGKQQITQMGILLKAGSKQFKDSRKNIVDSKDEEIRLANSMRKSVGNSIKLIESAAMGQGINILEQLFGGEDPAETLTNVATAIQNFDTKPIVDGLKAAIEVIKETTKWIIENKDLLLALGKGFLMFKTASLVGELAKGTAGLLSFAGNMAGAGAQSSKFAAGLPKVIGGLKSANALLLSFGVGLAAGTALWEQYESNQKLKLENRNKALGLERQAQKADFTQYSDKNLKNLLKLEKGNLETVKDSAREWFLNDQEKAERNRLVQSKRETLNRLRSEISRREKISALPKSSKQEIIKTERREEIQRVEFDKPPEGVRITKLDRGKTK